MIEFESSSLKTSNEHVDVVQAVSLKLDAKKIGILLKSRKRPVANLALGENQVVAAACCRAAPARCRAARVPDRRSRDCAGACSGVAGQFA